MTPSRRCVQALFRLLLVLIPCAFPVSAGSAQALRADVELSTKGADSRETVLCDFVADAIRADSKADISFIAASSFDEVTIAKGNVTSADVLRSLGYKNDNILLVKLSGDQIVRALENGLYLYPKANSGFLQFSGLVVTINPAAEKEKRVVSVKVGGDSLDASKSYRVAMPAPLANGALLYYKIWKKSDIQKDTERTLETAVTTYLTDHKTITKGDDRLVPKGK